MDARPSSVLRPELLLEIPCSAGLRVPPDRRLAVARGGAHSADFAASGAADNRSAPRRFARLLKYDIGSSWWRRPTGGQVLVKGLPTQTTIAGSDPGTDLLRVNTLDGDDNVTVAPDVADLMATAVDLGADG